MDRGAAPLAAAAARLRPRGHGRARAVPACAVALGPVPALAAPPLRWRTWLTFDPALKGRSFLWALHSVVGTWALVVYLMLTATGLYWAFDAVRDTVDGWAGIPRPARTAAPAPRAGGKAGPDAADAAPLDLTRAWRTFEQRAGPWTQASLRLPARPTQAVQFTWLATDATHDRQRNRMSIEPLTGEVPVDDRHAQRSAAARALATIYPLHMGTYFGLPGRVAVMVGSLAMPLFAVTGWMLYLGRRRQRRATEAARAAHGQPAPLAAGGAVQGADTLLVAYASQAGQAERMALQSAAALQRAGLGVAVQSLQALTPAMLAGHRRVLLVASSFGEGEPPDNARRFARLLAQQPPDSLQGVRYGLLALGDRNYTRFCGFGHALDEGLRRAGAEPLFPLIEVDDADPAALARWSEALAALDGVAHLALEGALAEGGMAPVYAPWRLERRDCLNPGSLGHPLFEVSLTSGTPAEWHPGALVEVLPRHASGAVAAWLQAAGADGAAPVQHGGGRTTLAEALAVSVLPPPPSGVAGASAQACADALVALAPRTYSVASCLATARCSCWSARSGMPRGWGWRRAGSPPMPRWVPKWLCAWWPIRASMPPRATHLASSSAMDRAWRACAPTFGPGCGRATGATGCCSASASGPTTTCAPKKSVAGRTRAFSNDWTGFSPAMGRPIAMCRTGCAMRRAPCANGSRRARWSMCAAAPKAWRPAWTQRWWRCLAPMPSMR